MKKSKLSILLLFLVMILAISAVSAADDTNDTSDAVMQAVDEAPLEEVASDSDVVGATDDTDIIADEGNNFTSLQTLIDQRGETVILDKDYVRVEGDSSLNINEDTTIVGGYHKIDAANLGGIFNVKSGVTLVLTGVTLVNGNSDYGGAIYNEGIVNIYDSTFENNTATVDGGAIYNNGTIEQLSSSTFKNNLAIHDGGAVYTNTDLTVDYNSVFNENTAKNEGGAIFAKAKSSLTVDQTTFSENKVSEGNYVHGGAIATGTSCSLIVTGCIFEDNVADLTKNSQGGAIWTQASCNVTITDSSFTNNQASRKGGAIYTGSKNSLIIKDSTFTKNTAAYAGSNGGAIAMYTNGELSIEGDCEFIANSAANGGAIHLDRTDANITGAVFSGNDAANQGGAIYLFESGKTVSVKNSTFTDNTNNGEANSIYLSIGNLELSGNTIHGNESEIYVAKSGKLLSEITVDILNHETVATYDGTYLVNATVTDDNGNPMTIVKGLTFVTDGAEVAAVYNATTKVYEGLLTLPAPGIFTVNATYIDEEKLTVKTATIKNFKGTFQDLQTRVNNCGGVLDLPYDFAYTPELGDTTSTGIRVSNNLIINGNGHTISGSNAARIFDISAPTTIDNLTIADGYYTASYGGAAIKATAMLNVTNTNFTNNGASDLIDKSVYGAVRTSTSASFDKCIFTDNYGRWGGAIGAEGSGTITIKNSKFENNNARQGGAIDIEGYTLIIDNTEFIGNDAVMLGGAVHTSQGTVTTVTNSKFERNTDYQGGAICSKGSTGSLTIDNSEFIANEVTGTERPGSDTWSSGGAIWVENKLTLTNSNFTANKAEYNGGAVYVQDGAASATIDNCRFENNKAGVNYGAIVLYASTNKVSNSYFDNNSANGQPNAITLNKGNLELSGNTIEGIDSEILIRGGQVTSQINITVMDNEEHNFSFHGVTLYAVVTDDNGNLITDSGFKFLVNTTEVTATYNPDTKLYEATYTPSDVGKYVVSMTYDGTATLVVKTANITFTKSLIDIQNMIDAAEAGDTIELTGDYAYVEEFDSSIKNGIVVNKTVTIDGKGYTISGSDAARVFKILANNVTIKNVTITNANSGQNWGGAINVNGAYENVTISNAKFYNNTGFNGGAIYFAGDNGKVIECEFEDNLATSSGGAIFWFGDNGKITDSTFKNNNATGNGGAVAWFTNGNVGGHDGIIEGSTFINNEATSGGAVTWQSPSGTITGSEFTENNARGNGGAIHWIGDEGTITGGKFTKNEAKGNLGGAIFLEAGSLDISSTFEENTASNGGAIALFGEADIKDSTFTDNTARSQGGAIFVLNADASVNASTFTGNNAPAGGKAIYINNGNLALEGNTIDSETPAIDVENGAKVISTIKVKILDAEVKTIDTLDAKLYAKVTDDNNNLIKDAQFKFTINDEEVAAVYNVSSKLYEATYTLPSAGIYPVNITYASDDELEVENGTVKSIYGTFTYLQKLAGLGPFIEIVRNYTYVEEIDGEALKDGVVFGDYAYYVINGNGYTISGNDVARIFNIRAPVLINNITFANGNAVDGGAVYIGSVSSGFVGFNPTYVNFINNTATRYGGAIYSEVAIDPVNCLFEDNAAGIYGGAIYIDGDSASSVSNSVFENNTAMQGGAIFHQKTGLIVKNSTFNDNKAIGTANGEYASGAAILSYLTEYVTIKDSNFTANNAQYNGGAIYFYNSNVDANVEIDNCRFEDNVAGDSYGTIYVTNLGNCEVNFNINNTKFINNTNKATTADYGSAALLFMGNNLTIANSEFTDNKGTKYSAVYYYARSTGTLTIDSTNFTNNDASVGNAVVYIVNGNAVISNAIFDSNTAAGSGEAVYVRAAATASISDSTFKNNGESTDYAIYNLGTLTLSKNNISNYIYSTGTISSSVNATFLGNAANNTIDAALYEEVHPYATLTDDNGNVIYDPTFKITVDGVELNTTYDEANKVYTANYTIPTAGDKVVSTNYDAVKTEGKYVVPKANVTEFTVTVIDTLEGKNATVFVTLIGVNENLTANVTVIVNNKEETVEVINGTGNKTIEDLAHGKYPVVAMFNGTSNYNSEINSTVFYVKGQSVLNITEVTVAEYGDEIEITINLTDSKGTPISGIVVIDNVNKVIVYEDGIGTFTIDIQPDVGDYTFQAVYDGNDDYFGCLDLFNVTVIPKVIDPKDVIVDIPIINEYGEAIPVTITSPVDGTYTVNVTGTVVEVEVVNGTGNATITLANPGIYNATVDIAEEEYSLETITTDEFEYLITPEFNVVITGTYPNAEISITGPAGTYHVDIDGFETINITREESGLPTIYTIEGIDAGDYTAIVSFDKHDGYYGDDKDVNFTVAKAASSVTIDPITNVVYANPVVITFNIVNETDVGEILITDENGKSYDCEINGSTVTAILPAGEYTISIHNGEDANYNESEETATFTVYKAEALNITYDGDLAVMGGGTVNITVASDATGYVIIDNNGVTLYGELENGKFTFDINDLTAGDYEITVTYYGDDNYNKTEATKVLTIPKAVVVPEITDLTAEILGGQNATFTVTMTNNFADGNVSIFVDGVLNQVVVLDADYANATVVISDLRNGTHTITVQYNGNDNYEAVVNATASVTVNRASSKVTIDPIDNSYDGSAVIIFTIENETDFVTISITDANDPEKSFDYEYADGVITVKDLAPGKYTVKINNGESDLYNESEASATFYVCGNVVTNETFFNYFDEDGVLLDVVPFDELIFTGEFSDLGITHVTVEDIAVTGGDDAVLYNIGFVAYGDVELSDMTLVANESIGSLIYVTGDNVDITGMDISYIVNNESSIVIDVYDVENVNIADNIIYFESHVPYDDIAAMAISVEDAFGVVIEDNEITANLTAVRSNWGIYYKYGTMGIDQVHAVRVAGSSEVELTGNDIVAVINDGISTGGYDSPTIEAVLVIDSDVVSIENNEFSVLDPITPEGIQSFLYALTLTSVYDLVVSNNDFYLSTKGGVDSVGTSYAIQLATCDVLISENSIVAENNGPMIGIYISGISSYSSLYNENFTVEIKDNDINVTGYSNTVSSASLVSGIEAAAGEIIITDNTIEVNNKAGYVEGANVYGVSYVQTYGSYVPEFDIEDNVIIVNDGKYAVAIINDAPAVVTYNILITHELYGDYAVHVNDTDAIIETNYPQDLNITITVENCTVSDPVEISVTTNPLFNGQITVTIGTNDYIINITDGEGGDMLDSVPANTYNVVASYAGDTYFKADEDNATLVVSRLVSNITITTGDVVVDAPLVVNVTMEYVDGNVTVIVDGNQFTLALDTGLGTFTIPKENMTAGNHSITVIFAGDDTYDPADATYNFTVEKAEDYEFDVNLTIDEIDIGENVTINVTLPEDANGNIAVTVDGKPVTFEKVVNGTATVTVPADAFTAGKNNTIAVTYSDDKYGETTVTKEIPVNKLPYAINATADNIELGQNATIIINVPAGADGKATVELQGNFYPAVDGKVILEGLGEGTYTANVYFFDDSVYEDNHTTVTFNVTKVEITPEQAFNFTTPENSTSEVISVNLPEDATGFLLLDINGTQTHVPLVNGTANVTVPNLEEGTYNATITYTGDDKYAPISTTKEINVTSNVPENALNIPAGSKSDEPTTYSISLPSDAGGFLMVDVDGTKYAAPLNNGSASVTVPALSAGSHNVTVTYTGDDKYSPVTKATTLNVTAPVFKITNNKNVAAVYSATATYKVLVTRDGKAVGAGEAVTFKYNGKTYTVRTDSKGYATFKPSTKVKVKKYTVTAEYKGVKVSNKVTIKHVIKAKNKKVKKSKKVNKVVITLKKVNKKYLKKKTIKVKFKGKTYKVKTNKKGKATWKVKKSMLKKLKVGKKYKYKVTYGKDKVTKKLTIKK